MEGNQASAEWTTITPLRQLIVESWGLAIWWGFDWQQTCLTISQGSSQSQSLPSIIWLQGAVERLSSSCRGYGVFICELWPQWASWGRKKIPGCNELASCVSSEEARMCGADYAAYSSVGGVVSERKGIELSTWEEKWVKGLTDGVFVIQTWNNL